MAIGQPNSPSPSSTSGATLDSCGVPLLSSQSLFSSLNRLNHARPSHEGGAGPSPPHASQPITSVLNLSVYDELQPQPSGCGDSPPKDFNGYLPAQYTPLTLDFRYWTPSDVLFDRSG